MKDSSILLFMSGHLTYILTVLIVGEGSFLWGTWQAYTIVGGTVLGIYLNIAGLMWCVYDEYKGGGDEVSL